MKAIIVVNDTPHGVTFTGEWKHNGCNDGPDQSLALLLLLQFNRKVTEMQARHILHIEKDIDEDDPPH